MAIKGTTTTDLETIRVRPDLFTWGRVKRIHDIGCYTVVEYSARCGNDEAERLSFAVYVDDQDARCSCDTLDRAIVMGISLKHNANGWATSKATGMAQAAYRVLGIGE